MNDTHDTLKSFSFLNGSILILILVSQLFHDHSDDEIDGFPFITTPSEMNHHLHFEKPLPHETNLGFVKDEDISWNHYKLYYDEFLGEDKKFDHLDAIT